MEQELQNWGLSWAVKESFAVPHPDVGTAAKHKSPARPLRAMERLHIYEVQVSRPQHCHCSTQEQFNVQRARKRACQHPSKSLPSSSLRFLTRAFTPLADGLC